jgi:hypothetical protein
MISLLREKLLEVLKAVAPLIVFVCLLQVTLVQAPIARFLQFLAASALAIVGMLLLLAGIDFGILPMGRFIGGELPKRGSLTLIVAVALALGFATTVAEPDVLVLAGQVEHASQGSTHKSLVLYAICTGVALMVGLGVLRITYDIPLLYLLAPGYILAIGLMWFSDKDFVGIAIDASGIATGPLANSFLLAFALGASAAMGSRKPIVHGFGMVALIALAPITPVMLLGVLARLRNRAKE